MCFHNPYAWDLLQTLLVFLLLPLRGSVRAAIYYPVFPFGLCDGPWRTSWCVFQEDLRQDLIIPGKGRTRLWQPLLAIAQYLILTWERCGSSINLHSGLEEQMWQVWNLSFSHVIPGYVIKWKKSVKRLLKILCGGYWVQHGDYRSKTGSEACSQRGCHSEGTLPWNVSFFRNAPSGTRMCYFIPSNILTIQREWSLMHIEFCNGGMLIQWWVWPHCSMLPISFCSIEFNSRHGVFWCFFPLLLQVYYGLFNPYLSEKSSLPCLCQIVSQDFPATPLTWLRLLHFKWVWEGLLVSSDTKGEALFPEPREDMVTMTAL